ncbi:MAG: matrixin family metalloprotease, partial [Myxococcota bacterium]
FDALGTEPRTPTVLVGWRLTRPRGPAGLVVAHEIGHLLGLAHHAGAGNLMSPTRRTDCLPALDDAQLQQLRVPVASPR